MPLPDPDEVDPVLTYYKAYYCASTTVSSTQKPFPNLHQKSRYQEENGYYFAIIFTFIFAPLLITFLWLNSVLAKEVWKRRIDVTVPSTESENTSTVTTATASNQAYVTPEISARRAERNLRQIRMFKVILVLMGVFFICRLPNWIYVLYKYNHQTQGNIHWVISYSLGLMMLANCMLNPFLYTFLSETIRLTTFVAGIICGIFVSPCARMCNCKKSRHANCSRSECEKPQMFNNM